MKLCPSDYCNAPILLCLSSVIIFLGSWGSPAQSGHSCENDNGESCSLEAWNDVISLEVEYLRGESAYKSAILRLGNYDFPKRRPSCEMKLAGPACY